VSIPRTSDGKPIHLVNRFPGNVTLYLTGAGDDIAGNKRGEGAQFELDRSTSGNTEHVAQWLDWIYLAGGEVTYSGGAAGCWVSLHLRFPATAVVANAGAGELDLVATGLGFNILIPNPATIGSHDRGTIVTPVPNESGQGYWHWDGADTGLGTITPVANPGAPDGAFDLFDVQLDAARFANRIPLRHGLGSGALVKNLNVNEIKPKKILPAWQLVTTIHHAGGANTLVVDWELITARIKTV
jgi:hypothetical protein